MTTHKLTPEYSARVERFRVVYPSAHAFLRRIESDGLHQELWLSTAVNAHLYKGNAFVAYLKLKNPELKPPSLVVSPRFNQQIAAHTSDQSARFFPEAFDRILSTHAGKASGWATVLAGGATELGSRTPAEFFDALYEELSRLHVS